MKDAADFLDVSEKTLRSYLKKGILPPPPQTKQGMRTLKYFPENYLQKAKQLF